MINFKDVSLEEQVHFETTLVDLFSQYADKQLSNKQLEYLEEQASLDPCLLIPIKENCYI